MKYLALGKSMSYEELDSAIRQLNERKNVRAILPDNLAQFALAPDEESLIKAYRPYRALITYGSLAPGKPNHKVVEGIRGEWKKAAVAGRLKRNAGEPIWFFRVFSSRGREAKRY